MAANVCIRVLSGRSSMDLSRLHVFGVIISFSVPFIIALTFLVLRPQGHPIYGDAVSWCWISQEFDLLRLLAFYVPIW